MAAFRGKSITRRIMPASELSAIYPKTRELMKQVTHDDKKDKCALYLR